MTCRSRNAVVFFFALTLIVCAPSFSYAQVSWAKDYDTALKQAAQEKKFIVLDISASW
jgi:hypothetical protein